MAESVAADAILATLLAEATMGATQRRDFSSCEWGVYGWKVYTYIAISVFFVWQGTAFFYTGWPQ